jgi:microcystin-dependent protein
VGDIAKRDEYKTRPKIGTQYIDARIGRAGEVNRMNQFVGQIIAVGFNFAPVGWALCNGQLLSISDNEVLYNLIGTTFGGNGQTNFAVPDLRGRSPLGQGTGAGLPPATVGQAAGTEAVTLTLSQIPGHSHPLLASSANGGVTKPTSTTALASAASTAVDIYGAPAGNLTLAPTAIGSAGGSQSHENRQPYNTVNFIIATAGVFPSQS